MTRSAPVPPRPKRESRARRASRDVKDHGPTTRQSWRGLRSGGPACGVPSPAASTMDGQGPRGHGPVLVGSDALVGGGVIGNTPGFRSWLSGLDLPAPRAPAARPVRRPVSDVRDGPVSCTPPWDLLARSARASACGRRSAEAAEAHTLPATSRRQVALRPLRRPFTHTIELLPPGPRPGSSRVRGPPPPTLRRHGGLRTGAPGHRPAPQRDGRRGGWDTGGALPLDAGRADRAGRRRHRARRLRRARLEEPYRRLVAALDDRRPTATSSAASCAATTPCATCAPGSRGRRPPGRPRPRPPPPCPPRSSSPGRPAPAPASCRSCSPSTRTSADRSPTRWPTRSVAADVDDDTRAVSGPSASSTSGATSTPASGRGRTRRPPARGVPLAHGTRSSTSASGRPTSTSPGWCPGGPSPTRCPSTPSTSGSCRCSRAAGPRRGCSSRRCT